jgi:hypothetical protein
MSETYYRVYPSDEVAAQMQSSACVSTSPRYNLDETEAILRFTEPVDGYITHTEAFFKPLHGKRSHYNEHPRRKSTARERLVPSRH